MSGPHTQKMHILILDLYAAKMPSAKGTSQYFVVPKKMSTFPKNKSMFPYNNPPIILPNLLQGQKNLSSIILNGHTLVVLFCFFILWRNDCWFGIPPNFEWLSHKNRFLYTILLYTKYVNTMIVMRHKCMRKQKLSGIRRTEKHILGVNIYASYYPFHIHF